MFGNERTGMTDTIQIAGSGLGNQVAGPLGRAFGWLAMGVSLVCCVPPFVIAITIARNGIGPSPTPLWATSLVLLCYVAFPVVFLCIGRGLLKGRVKLAAGGGLFLVGTLLMFLTLFNTFD